MGDGWRDVTPYKRSLAEKMTYEQRSEGGKKKKTEEAQHGEISRKRVPVPGNTSAKALGSHTCGRAREVSAEWPEQSPLAEMGRLSGAC